MAEDFTTLSELDTLMSEDGGAAIIDFWSPSCGPCKAMAPAFEALSNELSEEPIRFIRINTAAQPKLAQPFHIHSVPTLLFVHNGEILDVRVGALPGPALAKKAQWLLRKSRGEGFLSRIFGA
ncbi:MAG: thioredoxin family protein [Deltaproteobacteria bacterium]|nr:thioredoxin family protein [Deltaproteobacteria bacterium]NNK43045.1 thioredoxin family protein [Myxococcales bacterium]MBT8463697.1 thioredoxin family protein [Deltaproteobacteria bacterium]MBT8480321.1 thioredoxin family protein [Deltaproteobacteria bacterium]NNL23186.1 thioredoxin family protein [Myxococcales bacterium]